MTIKLSEIVAKNRAEEFPDDLWGKYVIPLEYDSSNLHKVTKGAVIEGGRGSGKTMFLKYHCHATMFSKNRLVIPESIFDHIGIYWKPDTSFTQLINDKWLGDKWQIVFNTYASLCLMSEICKMCINISDSGFHDEKLKKEFLYLKVPSVLAESLGVEVKPLSELLDDVRACIYKLTSWINFPDTDLPPYRLSLKPTVELVLEHVRKLNHTVSLTTFHILIDEFENLSSFQQKVINTLLKHSDRNLIFSIAHKKNAKVSNDTLSQEKIVETNDFRRIDLESIYLNENNPKAYEILASEILTLKLYEVGLPGCNNQSEIIKNYSNPEFLIKRKSVKYQDDISSIAKSLFKSTSLKEVSENLVHDSVLLKKLKDNLISEGLKKHSSDKYVSDDFCDVMFPEASIVNGAILNRNNTDVDKLKNFFESYKEGEEGPYKGWISNNLYGVILYIYNTLPRRECPLYVGFNQFIKLSKGNLRNFLELCYQTFSRAETEGGAEYLKLPIGLEIQGKAAKATSTAQLEKIEELGSNGIHLKRLAKRLGAIFSLSQKRRSQSEPEVNHFTIATSDISLLDDETKKLLNEATVWSVLFSTKGTKTKSNSEIDMVDYVLHPVLSCHFGISPRKKRKLKFDVNEIKVICYGKDDDFLVIQNRLVKQWELEKEVSISSKADENQILNGGQYSLL